MANIIFFNGRIYSQTGKICSAIAVEGNRIEATGSDEEILQLGESGCEYIDLQGKCVLPGFCDSHCHVLLNGLGREQVDLRGCRSVEEIIERGRNYIRENQIPEGTWVIGAGYDHNTFTEARQPQMKDLDAISTKHPILFERFCGHIGAANSLAFSRIGFDEYAVIEGEGGIIEKDSDGNVNGILVETALDVFKRNIPKADVEQAKRAILRIFEEAASYGVTSMHTDDLGGAPLNVVLQAYQELQEEGKTTVRIWEEVQMPRVPMLQQFLKLGLRTGSGNEYFKIGNIKLITDGSLGARTALFKEAYTDDPKNCGVGVYTQEALDEIVQMAHESGLQLACHAIGDGAIR